ncbi:MAG: hypothetical protein KDJ25_05625 [Rhodoblastus sp.]|nr:hypothetical protein [Rhodoblastus sp.]
MKTFIACIASLSAFCGGAIASPLSDSDRLALQAAMVQHIDRQTVDGLFPWFDLKSGAVGNYSPAKSHPMIVRSGETFVLCTDFKDMGGAPTNVDFYMMRRGKGFAVIRTEIANRAPLETLMNAGKARPAD